MPTPRIFLEDVVNLTYLIRIRRIRICSQSRNLPSFDSCEFVHDEFVQNVYNSVQNAIVEIF